MALSDIDKSPLYIDSTNSRVGIGTTSANKSSSSTALTVNTSSAGNYSALELSSGDTLNWYINSNNAAVYDVTAGTRPRIFYTNGAERMRIDSNGTIMTGKTVENTATDGIELNRNNVLVATRNNDAPLILNRRSSDGEIAVFRKDNTTVGSIGTSTSYSGQMAINASSSNLIINANGSDYAFDSNQFYPLTANRNLGLSSNQFGNLYLSGGVVFGATGGSVTGKTLDDYEEGNWTPQFGGSSTTGTGTYSTTVGRYVKVGKKVNCWGIIVSSGTHNGTGTLQIHGLPFTKENTYLSWGTETNIAYHISLIPFGTATNVIRLLGPVSNGTFIRFHSFQNTGDTSVPPTPANVQSGTAVYFSATYEVQ